MSTNFKPDESRRNTSNKDGDWICPDSECQNLNFARRSQCNRCGQDRPHGSEKSNSSSGGSTGEQCSGTGSKKKVGIEIGKHAAEKSRGLFSAEDWQCSKCANVNWARRHTCNLCNAPRFCEVEERTGYGGGYNDRGVVEYKERSESDDDYDEFGRRKKKRSNSDSRSKPTPSETQPKPSHRKPRHEADEDEEEDDDDDDDDNGDLSKYDLWGSDAEEKETNKNDKLPQLNQNKRKASSNSSSSSRSRSRSPRGRTNRDRNRSSHYRNKRSRSRSRSPRSSKHYSSTSSRR